MIMKGTIVAAVVGVALALGTIGVSRGWQAGAGAAVRSITVKGESRLTGEPDTARAVFGVAKTGKTVVEGQKRMAEAISKVIAALGEAGVKKEDVATSELSISQGWDYRKNVPRGFDVSCALTVTVRNVQHVGRVVDAAVASGLNRLRGVSYEVHGDRWREKALREALDQAREKAQLIAARTGRRLGRVLSVQEIEEWQASPMEDYYAGGYARYRFEGEYYAREAMPKTRALPGTRAMTVQVEAVYAL